jgi:hypothetical protein
MRKVLLILFLLGPLVATAAPQAADEIFQGANQSMTDGHYDQAAEGYRSLLSMGIENGSLHGNLGQALFRQGKLGEAVFHYVMATKLKPRDPDLEANSAYLRGRATDKIEAHPQNLVGRILQNVSSKMNTKENWIGFISLWFLFWIVVAVRLYWKRELLRWSSWILGAGLILMSASLLQKECLERPIGIVTSQEAKVYSGPGESNVLLFELHEGAEVSVLPHGESGWVPIELADGKKGWMNSDRLVMEGGS